MVCNLIDQEIPRYRDGDAWSSVEPDADPGGDAPIITTLSADAGTTSVSLSWPAISNADSISLYRRDVTAGGSFALVTSAIAGSATSYSDTGRASENQYQYYIRATNEFGTSASSNTVSVTTDAASSGSDFVQFGAEYFVPSNITKMIIHPRPDAETNPWAISRHCYPGLIRRIPVEVIGFAPPLHYTVDGPDWMYFAENFYTYDEATNTYVDGDDVGMLVFDAPPAGSYEYTITVRGQGEGDLLETTNEIVVSTVGTGFVATTGNDANAGTLASPKRNIEAFCTGEFANYQICVMAGTYRPLQTVNFSGANNPKVIYNYNNDVVIFDARGDDEEETGGLILADSGDDISVSGITFDQSMAFGTPRHLYFTTNFTGARQTIYNCKFQNFAMGAGAGDNPAPITIYDAGVYRSHWVMRNLTFENISTETSTAAMGSFYNVENMVIRNIKFLAEINADKGVYIKGRGKNIWITEVESIEDNLYAGAVTLRLAGNSDMIEITNCRLKGDAFNDQMQLRWQQSNADASTVSRVYIQRCNINGRVGYGGSSSGFNSQILLTKNIVVSNTDATPIDVTISDTVVTLVDNITGNNASNYLNLTTLDISAGAAASLGIRGAQYSNGA